MTFFIQTEKNEKEFLRKFIYFAVKKKLTLNAI